MPIYPAQSVEWLKCYAPEVLCTVGFLLYNLQDLSAEVQVACSLSVCGFLMVVRWFQYVEVMGCCSSAC